jgi:tetratricopeptide (TPR) repeat protein
MFKGEIQKAHQMYAQVAADQRHVDPESKQGSLFFTLVYQGQAEYLMNKTPQALETLSSALEGFKSLFGEESNGYLVAQLRYAHINASNGYVIESLQLMDDIRLTREKQYGPDDSFAITTRIYMGDLHRVLDNQEPAVANLERGVALRRQFMPISHLVTLDPAITLAIAYRDFEMYDKADKLVEEVEKAGMLEQEDRFVRLCQVKHLRSLLLFDGGEIDDAINTLQTLLIEVDRERMNRALLWICLDLATMLRHRSNEGDEHAARSLFHDIVEDIDSNEPRDEPDGPRLLELAEKAVRLVRDGRLDDANVFLRAERLWWVRESDLWLHLGMPAADTTCMKPPRESSHGINYVAGWAHVGAEP